MSARSIATWERLGSEAECEDRMAAARGETLIPIALRDDLESVLAAHCDTDLHDPEILGVSAADIAEETPDFRAAYTAALAALVRGYREGA